MRGGDTDAAQSQSEQKRLDSSCEDGRAEMVLVSPSE